MNEQQQQQFVDALAAGVAQAQRQQTQQRQGLSYHRVSDAINLAYNEQNGHANLEERDGYGQLIGLTRIEDRLTRQSLFHLVFIVEKKNAEVADMVGSFARAQEQINAANAKVATLSDENQRLHRENTDLINELEELRKHHCASMPRKK